MTPPTDLSAAEVNRRDFLKGSSMASLMALLGGVPLIAPARAAEAPAAPPSGATLKCALIGCGQWGRDILNTLARLPAAEVVAVCDTYPVMVRRAKEAAPKAEGFEDYTKILENREIQAVLVATPTHQHKDIVLAALKAGKHVYCEAPLAHTIEDARVIAQAAQAAPTQLFQAGLLLRSDPQRRFLFDFVRAGAAGRTLRAAAQWHKKQSWRRTSPNADRETELNWRLRRDLSPGLIGELGIHQLDVIHWFLDRRPVAVTGFGSTILWQDGRDTPDTEHAVFELPGGALVNFSGTLGNSFDADYEMIYGSDAAVMLRGNKAWMFKEVDAPLLGWEVYARKDSFYKETGIALVANATKLVAQGDKPVEDAPYTNTPLYYALEAFLYNADVVGNAARDFLENFGGDDPAALAAHIAQESANNLPAATAAEAYEATVIALKGNEAIRTKSRVTLDPALFKLA
jgi:predicted dehydrogenase